MKAKVFVTPGGWCEIIPRDFQEHPSHDLEKHYTDRRRFRGVEGPPLRLKTDPNIFSCELLYQRDFGKAGNPQYV